MLQNYLLEIFLCLIAGYIYQTKKWGDISREKEQDAIKKKSDRFGEMYL